MALILAYFVGLVWLQLYESASIGKGQERLRSLVAKPLSSGREEHPIGYWIAKDFFAQKSVPEIVIFGDSQLGGLRAADAKVVGKKLDFALDHKSYALQSALAHHLGKSRPGVFVASQPGSLISDYFVIIESLFSKTRKPNLVILALSPREFLDNGLAYPGDSNYFRFFAPYADLGKANNLAYPDFGAKLNANLKVLTRRAIPSVTPSQFMFAPEDKQVYRSVDPVYSIFDMNMNSSRCWHQIRFLKETLNFLQELDVKTLVVFMPIPECDCNLEVKKFAIQLLPSITSLCNESETHFFDLNNIENKFCQSDFLDPIHLSQFGGEKFAKELASYLADQLRD